MQKGKKSLKKKKGKKLGVKKRSEIPSEDWASNPVRSHEVE